MSDVMMKALQLQVESLTRQVDQLGPENQRVRKLLTEFDQRHDTDQSTIAALTAERDALLDRDIHGLQQAAAMARAMNDLLASPKGVVPESAAPFYDAKRGLFFGLEVRKATTGDRP